MASPLQDSVGNITLRRSTMWRRPKAPTCRTSIPSQHTLLIHGLLDRPLTLNHGDLKRLPSVTRLHFVEVRKPATTAVRRPCGNARDDELLRMAGVLLSTLLKGAA